MCYTGRDTSLLTQPCKSIVQIIRMDSAVPYYYYLLMLYVRSCIRCLGYCKTPKSLITKRLPHFSTFFYFFFFLLLCHKTLNRNLIIDVRLWSTCDWTEPHTSSRRQEELPYLYVPSSMRQTSQSMAKSRTFFVLSCPHYNMNKYEMRRRRVFFWLATTSFVKPSSVQTYYLWKLGRRGLI